MCNCASCKPMHVRPVDGHIVWPQPKGKIAPARIDRLRSLSTAQLLALDKGYKTHLAYQRRDRSPDVLRGSPFPCTGTPESDPRIFYHFPGGQIGRARHARLGSLCERTNHPAQSNNTAEYVRRFTESNYLRG